MRCGTSPPQGLSILFTGQARGNEGGRAKMQRRDLAGFPGTALICPTNLWALWGAAVDYEAALAILAEADCVVAVVTGHSHPGGYQQDAEAPPPLT